MDFLKIKDNSIIICSNKIKSEILHYFNSNNIFKNVEFYTLRELKENLFFKYNKNTLLFLVKNLSMDPNEANFFLESLYLSIFDEKQVLDKINLYKIKKDLDNNFLLSYQPFFKNHLKNKKIYTMGYDENDDFLAYLNKNYKINNIELKENQQNVVTYELKSKEDEVILVANKIAALIEGGVSPNKIKLANLPSDYQKEVNKIFTLYNIPFSMENKHSLFSFYLGQVFLQEINKNKDIKLSLENIKERVSEKEIVIYNHIITFCNDFTSFDLSKKEDLSVFIYYFKKKQITLDKKDNVVTCADLSSLSYFDNYIFLMGMNLGVFPKIHKDDDYISDALKKEMNIETSNIKNKNNYLFYKKLILNAKNIFISYRLYNNDEHMIPYLLVDEKEFKVKKVETLLFDEIYSLKHLKLRASYDLDNYIDHNKFDPNLNKYASVFSFDFYKSYDNSYTPIDINDYKEFIDYKISISPSSLNTFYECKFKYYLNHVLKLNSHNESFSLSFGNIIHEALNNIENKDFNVKNFLEEKENIFKTNKDKFFYKLLCPKIKEGFYFIKNYHKENNIENSVLEEHINFKFKEDDIEFNINGKIDKYYYINNKIVIVDYKSSQIYEAKNYNFDLINQGLNHQLFFYYYLISKKEKTSPIIALLYQPLFYKIGLNKKTYEKRFKYKGFLPDEKEIIKNIGENYIESKIFKKDETFTAAALKKYILEKNNFQHQFKITKKLIEEMKKDLKNANFEITPKMYKKELVSCKFCDYNSVCFKEKKDCQKIEESR